MYRTLALAAAITVAACMLPRPVWAAPSISAPRATVVHPHVGCSATVAAFSFAGFSPLTQTGRFSEGYVTFNCASSVADIEVSSGASGEFRARRMTAAGDTLATLSYNIFLDPSHTQIFGDGTGGSVTYRPAPNVTKGGFAIYGEIADGQSHVRVAQYSDTISITINLAP